MFSNIKKRMNHRKTLQHAPAPAPPETKPANNKADFLIGGIFVSAIALLLLVAGYVITRMSSDAAYKKKWEDYQDCGWA